MLTIRAKKVIDPAKLLVKKKEDNKKNVILIVARSIPADVHSSYLVEKLINFLLSEDELVKKLKKKYTFKIIPMMSVDGVIIGNTYTTITGVEIYKDWREPE